jgi:hypothetical protein
MMYQVTIIFNDDGSNRFNMSKIPSIGEEVAIVHGNGDENIYKITKVRHRAYRCGIDQSRYSHESTAIVWGELVVDAGSYIPFPT